MRVGVVSSSARTTSAEHTATTRITQTIDTWLMTLLSVSRVSNLMRYPTRFWNTPGPFEMSVPCSHRRFHRLGIVSRIDIETNLTAVTFQVRSLSSFFLPSIKVKVVN